MASSLPERTVDAWVTAAVTKKFPNAQIWAPTQRAMNNHDYGMELGNGRIFILEDKGTTAVERSSKPPLHTHRIVINRQQLINYCDYTDHEIAQVYYVLPRPPWPESANDETKVVPKAAGWRTNQAEPFDSWARVIHCKQLRKTLNAATSFETHNFPWDETYSLRQFLELVAQGYAGTRVRQVDAEDHRVSYGVPSSARQISRLRQGDKQARGAHASSALAFFIHQEL